MGGEGPFLAIARLWDMKPDARGLIRHPEGKLSVLNVRPRARSNSAGLDVQPFE
jgi:hypothetical protein